MTQPGEYDDEAEFLAEFYPEPSDAERIGREAGRLVDEHRGRVLAELRRLAGAAPADLARAMQVGPDRVAAVESGAESAAGPVLSYVAALGGRLVVETVLPRGGRLGFDLPTPDSPLLVAGAFDEWSARCRGAVSTVVAAALPVPPAAEEVAAVLRRPWAEWPTAGPELEAVEAHLVAVVDGWRAEIG